MAKASPSGKGIRRSLRSIWTDLRPLGFSSGLHYRELTDAACHSLKIAGHSDARLVMFGSSVTGFSDRSGTSFDTDGKSDCDLAIVSPGAVFSST